MDILTNQQHWFSERHADSATAFSLEITQCLHEEQTDYQKIAIFETKSFGNLMVIDDCIMLTQRDNFIYHEMMTHPALFNHPAPHHVVIIGGGDCGTLREVAKHKEVEQITQVEIDYRVTELSLEFFPELCTANQDSRVQFEFTDAIQWMQQAADASIDLIIVDSTDPIGPAEGLFREAFYRDCERVLAADGILVQQSESPLVHWESITKKMQLAMATAGFAKQQTLFFPQPVYPTGWWSATLATRHQLHLVRDQQCKAAEFDTDYYNYGIHLAATALPNFILKQS